MAETERPPNVPADWVLRECQAPDCPWMVWVPDIQIEGGPPILAVHSAACALKVTESLTPGRGEWGFDCLLCGHTEAWTTELARQAAGAWHVYDVHRTEWMDTVKEDRAPAGERPEAYGRKLEDWERQS